MVLWFCDHPQWTTLNMNGKTDGKSWKSSFLITYTNLYLIHTPQPTSKRKEFKTDKKRYKSVQKRKVQHLYQKDRGISLGNLKSWGPWNKKNSNHKTVNFEQPGKQFWLEEHNFNLPVPRALSPLWLKLFEYFNCVSNKGLDNAIAMTIFFLWKSGALARSNFWQLLALPDNQVQHIYNQGIWFEWYTYILLQNAMTGGDFNQNKRKNFTSLTHKQHHSCWSYSLSHSHILGSDSNRLSISIY